MTCDCQLLFFLEIFQQNSKDPQNGLSMLLCKSFGGPSSQLWKPFVIWIFYSGKMVKDVKVCCVTFNFQAMVWWKTLPGPSEKLAKGQIDLKQFRQGSEFVGFYKNHNLLSCVGCVRSSQLWSKLALLTVKLNSEQIWSKVITCCCDESPVLSRLNLLKSENFIFKSHTFSRNLKSAAFTFLIVFNTRAVSALQSPSLVTERPLVASQRLFYH